MLLFRVLRRIVGAILFVVLPLWKFVRETVSWGGNLDFVISRSQDPGWVGLAINRLLDPPAWSLIPLMLAGFALLWWDVRRTHQRAQAEKQPERSHALDRRSALERALVENPERVKGSPLYLKFQSWFDPQTGTLSPADKVSRGRAELEKVGEAALKGDYEAYLLAGHLGSWLRANARFYWASSEPYHEMAQFIDQKLDQLHNHLRGRQSPEPPSVSKESRLEWAQGRTRFQIWEAACYIHDLALLDYVSSDRARSTANEMMYYAQQGFINLAGETDLTRQRRVVTGRPSLQIHEQTFLSAETVQDLKERGLSSWFPIIDELNRERRS